ncbi:MAG: hypothetical protein ABW321_17280 [Polyangiales bacterium]
MTKGAYYRYATFYAEDGTDLTDVLMKNGHRSTSAVPTQAARCRRRVSAPLTPKEIS